VIFVYGSEKEMWRACGSVVVLKELDVSKIPRGAVLYTDLPLRAAAKIKLKAPWIKVRIGGVEVADVQLFAPPSFCATLRSGEPARSTCRTTPLGRPLIGSPTGAS